MEVFLIRALQLLLSLSILVFIHELGHFLFARLFKVRVEKFYLFFNPKKSLIRAKKINGSWQVKFFANNVPANERPKKDEDGYTITDAKGNARMEQIPLNELPDGDWRKYPESTEWGIGWLPLGGYCKIAGMIDESMDTTQMAQAPKSWEYRSRPTWQRLPIILGGVLFNFIFAAMIYIGILFVNGQSFISVENAKYGLEFSETMQNVGFQHGDKILKINGQPAGSERNVFEQIVIGGRRDITVLRGNETMQIELPTDFTQQFLAANDRKLFSIRHPFVIGRVFAGTPAEKVSLQAGDSIIGINGQPMFIFQEITRELERLKNTTIDLEFVRNNEIMITQLGLGDDGRLGVRVRILPDFIVVERIEYNFLQAIPAGIRLGWETLTSYVRQFRIVFTREGAQHMGGFGTIGSMFPASWNWHVFWSMTAMLSIALGFINVLPIPALDGGHMVFVLYEMITRRKPSQKFMEYAQMVGFFIVIALVLFANGNDILRLFR